MQNNSLQNKQNFIRFLQRGITTFSRVDWQTLMRYPAYIEIIVITTKFLRFDCSLTKQFD